MLKAIVLRMKCHYAILLLIFWLLPIINAAAQIVPAEGDTINYRLAGFKVPPRKGATHFVFEIAEGYLNDTGQFGKNKLISDTSESNRKVITLPAFGASYTWRACYFNERGKQLGSTALHHIRTGYVRFIDTSLYRLRILTEATEHKKLLVILDSRVIYDMSGIPVWYLPTIPGVLSDSNVVRDLKPTGSGGFTFVHDNTACEADYNGRLLWQAPKDVSVNERAEVYHHECTKLKTGHYLTAGQDQFSYRDSSGAEVSIISGTLIEIDSSGKVHWYWKAKDYFRRVQNGTMIDPRANMTVHLNSFYYDEKAEMVYASFRDINTILKIEKNTGRVVADYYQDKPPLLFQKQHGCRKAANGDLYLYNNNLPGRVPPLNPSSVVRLQEPADSSDRLKKVWEFDCNIDAQTRPVTVTGGSAYELQNGSMLVCAGSSSRVFIVDANKRLTWHAIPEVKQQGGWRPLLQYRANFIEDDSVLEDLIFGVQ